MAALHNVKYIQYFHRILATPAGALPKGVTWIVAFEDLRRYILPGVKKALSMNEPGVWAIEEAARIITGPRYQSTGGCMLAQAIDLPSFNTNVIPEGNIQYNAFLRTYVGQGRADFPLMRMSFLETNLSFTDNFLRPWALSTACFGLLARPRTDERNYRTDMYCWQLGGVSSKKPPTILKQITFHDICCVSVNNEELNYVAQTAPVIREAQFIYNHYTIKSSSELNEFISLALGGTSIASG